MKKLAKLTILMSLALALTMVVSGCVKKPETVNTTNIDKVNTSDWGRYETKGSSLLVINTKNSFSFQYPKSWFVTEGGVNNIGLVLASSYSQDTVIRSPERSDEYLVQFEVGYPQSSTNFVDGMPLEEWCNNDLLSADIHKFDPQHTNLKILEQGEDLINGQLLPFIAYTYKDDGKMYKTLCLKVKDEIEVINYISTSRSEEIYKAIISSIKF